MNSKLFSFLKYLLLLTIALGLLLFAFRGINVKSVMQEIFRANIFWVLLSISMTFAALISRAWRWKLLIESTGHTARLKNIFYALNIGYFANLAFPRLGEMTRCGSLSKQESVPFTNLLGTVIIERVVDLVSLFICLLLTAVLEYQRLGDFLQTSIIQPMVDRVRLIAGSTIFIIIAIALLIGLVFFIYWYIKRIKQKAHHTKWIKLIKDLISGLRSIARLNKPWQFIFHSVLIWVLYFMSTYLCFFALPATSELGFSAALLLLVAGGLAISAPVQGGIGAYHLLVSQGLILYGLSQQDGLTFATLVHSLQLMLIVVLGILSMLLIFSLKKKVAGA